MAGTQIGHGHRKAERWVNPPDLPIDPLRAWRPFVRMESSPTEGQPPPADPGAGSKTFTQADLDRILAKERAIWERKHGAGGEAERAELDRLRQEREEREQRDAEAAKEWEKSKQLLADRHAKEVAKRDESLKTMTAELRTERIRRALVAEAAKVGAVDPELVADTLERKCSLNDKFQAEATDDDGGLVTIAELVTGFLGAKPFLVRPGSTGQGGGSRGGASMGADHAPGSPDLQAARKALEEADKLARASGMPNDLARAQTAHKRVKDLEAKAAGR